MDAVHARPRGGCTAPTPTRTARKDPYNPVDAIFAAARYLTAAGYENDVRRAIFAYNHADWYVDSVLLRTRLIAGVPADLVGSLTGLTEGRFPVYARARYADDLAERDAAQARQGRARTPPTSSSPSDGRRIIEIFARQGAPVVAVNDGQVKKIGENRQARALHRAPGRVRQPLHLRAPRLGRRPTTPCRRPTPIRPQRHAPSPQAQRRRGPSADRARLGRQPARPRRARDRRDRARRPRDARRPRSP